MDKLILAMTLKERISEWNNQAYAFSEKYLSSPWIGYVIFAVILAAAWAFIKGFSSK